MQCVHCVPHGLTSRPSRAKCRAQAEAAGSRRVSSAGHCVECKSTSMVVAHKQLAFWQLPWPHVPSKTLRIQPSEACSASQKMVFGVMGWEFGSRKAPWIANSWQQTDRPTDLEKLLQGKRVRIKQTNSRHMFQLQWSFPLRHDSCRLLPIVVSTSPREHVQW